jgi:hypothetical protein
MYVYHHIISVMILTGLLYTNNLAVYFLSFIIAETSGFLVNLRKLILLEYKHINSILNISIILMYFYIRCMFAVYKLYYLIQYHYERFECYFITTSTGTQFIHSISTNSYINSIVLTLCTFIVCVSFFWFFIMFRSAIYYKPKTNVLKTKTDVLKTKASFSKKNN